MQSLVTPSKNRQNASKGCGLAALDSHPDGNHGDNRMTVNPPTSNQTTERTRLSVDLSLVVSSHLDHISEVTGVSKSGIITAALLDALPALLLRADGLKKRYTELTQSKPRK
jgi:Cft2 family RNA processing exonuclease